MFSRTSLPPARRVCAGILLLALVAAPALAATADADLDAGVQLVQRASDGDGAAIEAAAAHFAKLYAADPGDPLLRAYAGSTEARKATATLLPWRKMSHAEEGLAQLDKALALLGPAHDSAMHRRVPVSLETRFVAANTFLALPAMFNRKARGEKLLDDILKSPLLEQTPMPFRASVWTRAAKAAHADGRSADEKRWLGLVAASGSPQAAAAQAALKERP